MPPRPIVHHVRAIDGSPAVVNVDSAGTVRCYRVHRTPAGRQSSRFCACTRITPAALAEVRDRAARGSAESWRIAR